MSLHWLICVSPGLKVVGFAMYYFTYDPWVGKQLYLEDFYVMQQYRGKNRVQFTFEPPHHHFCINTLCSLSLQGWASARRSCGTSVMWVCDLNTAQCLQEVFKQKKIENRNIIISLVTELWFTNNNSDMCDHWQVQQSTNQSWAGEIKDEKWNPLQISVHVFISVPSGTTLKSTNLSNHVMMNQLSELRRKKLEKLGNGAAVKYKHKARVTPQSYS